MDLDRCRRQDWGTSLVGNYKIKYIEKEDEQYVTEGSVERRKTNPLKKITIMTKIEFN